MISFSLALDISGTAVFALSGSLVGVRKDLDIFGVSVLAVAAALGGGMVRDVLLGAVPPAALQHQVYLVTALVAALIGFRFHPRVGRLQASIQLLDAAGLGVFAVSGTLRSLAAGLGPISAILLGVITGVGGGVVRDVLAGEIPVVLRRDIYAVAALLGAAALVAAHRADVPDVPAAVAGVVITFAVRALAIRFNWQAPHARRSGGDRRG